MSRDTRTKRDLHALNADGMVTCNPRDKEAAHRAEMEGIATDDHSKVTCRKCLSLLHRDKNRPNDGRAMVQRQQEYDADLRHLPSMRAFLRHVCHESWQAGPADEILIRRLALALTEAASNIILHGFQGQQHPSITLTIDVDDDEACVTLQHAGKPFDPQAAPPPVFDGSQESGFGVYLIRQSVDEVHYCQDDQGRCVLRLVQKRKQRTA